MEDALSESARSAEKLSNELDNTARSASAVTRESEQLEQTLREVERISARSATEIQSIALAAGRADVNFEDLARSLNISEDAARGMATEILQAQAASNRLEDSARDIARQLGLSEEETRRFASSLNRASREADDIDVKSKGLATSFSSLRAAASGVAGAFAAIGLGNVFGSAIQGAKAAVAQFSALNESINAVRVTFGNASAQVLAFGERSAESAGLSAQAFQQAVVPIGAVLRNFGFDAEQAASASITLVQRAADLASVFNTDVATALLAINSALVGQVEPLRRFGAEISVARVEAFALATGLAASKSEIDNAILTQARFGLILADTAAVQNDFINTSGEFANASRIAGASVEEFGADVGEALLPALEGFLLIVPDILEGLRQLVPGFAAAADSANEFFTSVNQDSGGFRAPLQAFSVGIGLVSDAFAGFGDLASFTLDTFTFEFSKADAQIAQFNDRIARTTQRIGGQALAQALDSGTDSITAFGNSLAFVAREQENIGVFGDSFRAFAIQANLSAAELQTVTRFMIENATQAGLSAGEVQFLTEQLALLNDALNGTDVGADRAANRLREGFSADVFNTITTQFTTFTTELESIPDRMDSVAAEARTAAGLLGEALNPFDDATEIIDVSAKEFFQNLVDQINEQAEFQAGLARLVAAGFGDLAAEIAAQGPGAQKALDQFLNNLNLAGRAEALLDGEGTAVARQIGDELVQELAASNLTPEVQQAFIDMLEAGIFSNSQVEDAIVTGTAAQAANVSSSFRDSLEQEGIDLTQVGKDAGITLITGMVIGVEAGTPDVKAAVESTVRNALEISSPSKVMMRLGQFAGAGLVEGFLAVANRPLPVLTGIQFGGTGASGGTTGGNVSTVTVNQTINHPTLSNLLTDIAQLDQTTGAAAAGLRAF